MKFYLFSFILESAVVRSEAEVVLGCENYVQVDAFIVTVVDSQCFMWSRRLLLSSRVSSSAIGHLHDGVILLLKGKTKGF